jgi:deoxycytidylate deaminase
MKGPCAKQTVTATIVAENGNMYISTNYCLTPQAICPRADLPTGEGYELCKDICRQVGHAEVNAIKLAGSDSVEATLYLSGHTYACDSCKKAAKEAGIKEIVIVR